MDCIVRQVTKSWTRLSDSHFRFHSSIGEWTKKMPCIHTLEKHSTIKRNKLLINTTCINLKSIMMSERSLILKEMHNVWFHLYRIPQQTKLFADEKNQEAGQVSTAKDYERTFTSNGQCPLSWYKFGLQYVLSKLNELFTEFMHFTICNFWN